MADDAAFADAYAAAKDSYAVVAAAQAKKNELVAELGAAKVAVKAAVGVWDGDRAVVKALEQQLGVGYYGGQSEPAEGVN